MTHHYFSFSDIPANRFKDALEDPVLARHPSFEHWASRARDGHVHARLVLTQMVNDSVRSVGHPFRHSFKLVFIMGAIHAFIPAIVRASYGGPFFGNRTSDVIVIVCCMIQNLTAFINNYMFLVVGLQVTHRL
jgi:hypothetical protein